MSVRIKDTDHGYKKVLKSASVKKGVVEVGILAGDGDAAKTGSPGLTVLEVATFHEFGLGVPERSFIRAYADENKDKINEWIRVLAAKIVKGDLTQVQALEQLGLKIQGGVQKRIADGIEPPLAQSTILRKGSSTPLIDTGQLRSSVSYRVKT